MKREEVEAEIRSALDRLHLSDPDFRLPTTPAGGLPVIEGAGPVFTHVALGRGGLSEDREVDGPEAVYLVLEAITSRIASDAEKQTRKRIKAGFWTRWKAKGEYGAGLDDYSRQTWMDGHVRLMGAIHRGWGTRVALHYDMMLRKYPLTRLEKSHTRKLDLTDYGVE